MPPDLLTALSSKPADRSRPEPAQPVPADRRDSFASHLKAESREPARAISPDRRKAVESAVRDVVGDNTAKVSLDRDNRITVEVDGETRTLSRDEIDALADAALGDASELAETLAGIIEALMTLDANSTEDQLSELAGMLDELAGALRLELTPEAPDTELLAKLGGLQLQQDASALDKALGSLADLARTLLSGTPELEAVGTKLADLLRTIEADEGAQAKLMALLDGAETPVPPKLASALEALLGKQNGAQKQAETTPELSAEAEADDTSDGEGELKLSDLGRTTRRDEAGTDFKNGTRDNAMAALGQQAGAKGDNASDDLLSQLAAQTGTRVEALPGAKPVAAGHLPSQQQINLPQVAFEISRHVQQGNSQFQIRLDPPELGRIEVKLDFDKHGQVHARLTVEKSETLDMMMRDQRALERALAQAGLDGAKTSLEFSLKDNPFSGQGEQNKDGENAPFALNELSELDEGTPLNTVTTLYRGSLNAGSVNIVA
ncbi:hypothetical protein GCM10007989_25310 [Devosia pacifica]|uniref:Flagellar hook-length control protein-like C-terminal domain-containing protein n=1 Tax=Devosia pacifica TaxID=1335967 RepID=A0A918VTT4_9HYPH|nr:flagellar hook-length control protein FliK [Devosia pacifica]GHA28212.1 hypothetical protein GCM10007989_25310 [Devosia pacifica]